MEIEAKDLLKLIKNMRRYPKKYAAAAAMWVNRAAFGTRTNVLDYMNRNMTIRSPGFLKGRVRVEKASSRQGSIRVQQATVGSIKADRHTGWAEQEGLKVDRRKKTVTMAARGGVLSKKVKPSLRMKPGKSRPKPGDYAGRTRRGRANVMLQELGRKRYRGAFVMYGHRKLRPGLYKFGPGPKGEQSLEAIQLFKRRPAKPQSKPWMRHSVRKYYAKLNRKRVWSDIMRRIK